MATTNEPLICPRCGHEIRPGSKVEIVGPDPDQGRRIFTDDDLLISHAVCPEPVA